MHDMICVSVPPPSLTDVLMQRAELAMHRAYTQTILDLINGGIELSLSWSNIKDEKSLHGLYESVASTIGNLPSLCDVLFHLHCGDMHEILRDIAELLSFGHFSNEVKRRMSGERRDQRELVTAYFRGKYYHHRACIHSGEKVVNLFDASAFGRSGRFLNARVLQFTKKLSMNSPVSFEDLAAEMKAFGYDPGEIRRCVIYLVRRRLIIEVDRMIDPADHFQIADEDQLVLSMSGEFYLDELVANHRYVAAMSDVTYIDSVTVDSAMKMRHQTAYDDFWNMSIMLDDVGLSLNAELQRLESEGTLGEFFERLELTRGFYSPAVQACYQVVTRLHASGRGQIDLDLLRKWERLRDLVAQIQAVKTSASA